MADPIKKKTAPWKRALIISVITYAIIIAVLIIMIIVLPPFVAPRSYNNPKYKNRNDDVSGLIGVNPGPVAVTPEQKGFFDPDTNYEIEAYLNGNIVPATKLSFTRQGTDQIHNDRDIALNLNVGNVIGIDIPTFTSFPVYWRFTNAELPQDPNRIYSLNPVANSQKQDFFLQDIPGNFSNSDCYNANQGATCSNAIVTTDVDNQDNPVYWKFEFSGITSGGDDYFKVYPVNSIAKPNDTYLSFAFGDGTFSDCKAAYPSAAKCTNITIVDKIYDSQVPVYWIVRKA